MKVTVKSRRMMFAELEPGWFVCDPQCTDITYLKLAGESTAEKNAYAAASDLFLHFLPDALVIPARAESIVVVVD